jgi:hypothetical protein
MCEAAGRFSVMVIAIRRAAYTALPRTSHTRYLLVITLSESASSPVKSNNKAYLKRHSAIKAADAD